MQFVVEICCDNAAFVEDTKVRDHDGEIIRILENVVADLKDGVLSAYNVPPKKRLVDKNGNTVGRAEYVREVV